MAIRRVRFPELAACLGGLLVVGAVQGAGLNDTGITFCGGAGTNTANCATVAADGGGHPRQDARYGRDAAAGRLTKVGGGEAGFDFTKISNTTLVVSDSVVADSANTGIIADAANAGATARVDVARSMMVNGYDGVTATSTAGTSLLTVGDSLVTGNSRYGLYQAGTAALNSLGNNTVTNNGTNSSGTIGSGSLM